MRRATFRRQRRLRAIDGEEGGEAVAALEAEVALLREENARLKAAQHRPPDLGTIVDRVRALPAHAAEAAQAAAAGDEAAQMLAEGLVLRDSLLHVCEELGRSIATVEARLRGLGAQDEGDDAVPGDARVVRRAPAFARRDRVTVGGGGARATDAA